MPSLPHSLIYLMPNMFLESIVLISNVQLTCLEKPHNNTEVSFSPVVAATGLLKTYCF